MYWLVLIAVGIIGFISYRFIRRLLIEIKVNKFREKGIFEKKNWSVIPFENAGIPMNMAFSEVATKNAYQSNFKVMFNLFINFALKADSRLDVDEVQRLIDLLYDDLSEIKFLSGSQNMTNEYCMLQSATLYALIYTQDKGANIKKRLMNSSQSSKNMFMQQKSDREYFEFMNKEHTNFCKMVGILDPRRAHLIEIVAGYLLSE